MMRQVLTALSLVLPMVPFAILMINDPVLGLILISAVLSIGLAGLFMNRPSAGSWTALVLALLISVASQGYIPYILHAVLIPIQNPALFNGSIVLIEYSLIASRLYEGYIRYVRELGGRGYDRVEVEGELNELTKWLLALLAIALLVSFIIYYAITMATIPLVDPFTALVIFAITYIVISRYVVSRIRSS